MRQLALLIAALVVAACTFPGQVAVLETEPAPTEKQLAERRVLLASERPMQPVPGERYDIAEVGGACAPQIAAKFAVTACVNNRPCNGHGLRTREGAVACACYDTPGGCAQDSFCNVRTRICTRLPADSYHLR